jgi:hypothetical protein
MQFRLRTLLVVLALAPPFIWLLAKTLSQGNPLVELNDPVLIIGVICWPLLFTRFVLLRRNVENP